MADTTQEIIIADLPLAPVNPLPCRQRRDALRDFHTGTDILRAAGGPVTRFSVGPRWLMPPIVLATSPQGIRDIVSVRDGSVDKTSAVASQLRSLIGGNLFVLPHEEWLPRRRTLQPVFTKKRVHSFAGHMAVAAEMIAASWFDVPDPGPGDRALIPDGAYPTNTHTRDQCSPGGQSSVALPESRT